MPELPELEAVARKLDGLLAGQVIDALEVRSIAALKTFDPPPQALSGETIAHVTRRGKFLIFATGRLNLAIHFARAGWLRWRDSQSTSRVSRPAARGPLAARLRFQSGNTLEFTEQGTQKRLALYLVRNPDDVPGIARLGIDVFDPEFNAVRLTQLLGSQSATVKNALADQSLLAGIGNAYSDEILHTARISPFARANSLDNETLDRLYKTIVSTLTEATHRAAQIDIREIKGDKRESLRIHGRTGESCPVCGDTIRQVSFATRSFQYCATCQTGGKIYADRRLSRLLK